MLRTLPLAAANTKRSAGQAFVLKHVPEQLFSVNQQVANDFSSTKRLRIHTDASTKDSILVYPYLRESLLDFDITDPELPPPQRLKIMRVVAEAVAELHAKGWIHAGMSGRWRISPSLG